MSGGHVAVVLAAGGSARLGRSKQLLTREGETLVHRSARLAAGSGAAQVWVVTGADAEAVQAAVVGLPCEPVHNADWRAGLAGSLRAVASRVTAAARPVLVLVCDQPALEGRHLDALLQGARDAASGIAATCYGEQARGVPALVPAEWFAMDADRFGPEGDQGFGARLRALHRDTLFLLDAPELGYDIDTPADLLDARDWLDPGQR